MRFHQPAPGICHLTFGDQRTMCEHFVRLQEFYESPHPTIRGRHFTLKEFAEVYAAANGGKWTYMTDWWGFNVPGNVVTQFYETFSDLRVEERALMVAVRNTDRTKDGRFYLIGSCPTAGDAHDAADHEIAHALFYLEPEYRTRTAECVRALRSSNPYVVGRIVEWLLAKGYCEDVLVDELQAYLATTDVAYWDEQLGLKDGQSAYAIGARLRELFRAFKP